MSEREHRRKRENAEETLKSTELLYAFDVLMHFMDNPQSAVFLEPVDWVALDLPVYPKIIKMPMDLGTIKKKLLSGEVQNIAAFARLMRLVFTNALKFNEPGSSIALLSESLLEEFEANYAELKALTATQGSNDGGRQQEQDTLIKSLEQEAEELEAQIQQTKEKIESTKQSQEESAKEIVEEKLRMQLPVNRIKKLKIIPPRLPLTYAEKEELCRRIEESLDRSAVPGLLEVISTSEISGDEVEVDIDKLDDDTLIKVQAYVDQTLRKPRRSLLSVDYDGEYSDKLSKRSSSHRTKQ
ncbi:uncharacterized protein LOC126304996 [Schistocerca gregaria]|uniref:uncharacterized protein LOC126304996 n=1 Tax=Schistocerca gregaria TaxID=7010 RepID=UPI00211DD764|nr:uncharacterized protein LOC126304996 [Schistocerca gregaria]